MKVCLINPPLTTNKGFYFLPLGLAYIGAVLREHHDVSIYDSQFQPRDHMVRSAAHSDVVGITCMSHNSLEAVAFACDVKRINPDTTIVLGGPHVTFTDGELLQQNPHIDVIVRHEGESTIAELLGALRTGNLSDVKGITYRENGRIRQNRERPFIQDLNCLPFPARDLLKAEQYYKRGSMPRILSGRGCPFKCIFCSTSAMWGHKVRLRSPENIVDEIEHVVKTYKITGLSFDDDTFTIFPQHTIGICEEIIERGLDIKWGCNVRVDTLNENVVQIMKKAGCIRFFIGVESANQKTLNLMNKRTTLSQIQKAVELAKKYSITTTLSCILGFPHETYADVKRTIDFVISLKSERYLFNFLMIYPGTELERRQQDLGLNPVDNHWEKVGKTSFQIPVVETETLSIEELSQLYLQTRVKLGRRMRSREIQR